MRLLMCFLLRCAREEDFCLKDQPELLGDVIISVPRAKLLNQLNMAIACRARVELFF